MLKLFILDNLSAFSSDTVFKICLSLEDKGLQEENTEKFIEKENLIQSKKNYKATRIQDVELLLVEVLMAQKL